MIRFFFAVVFMASVAGCATTQSRNQTEQLQSRVVDLEKKLEEKDSEIVDLQYEVKDLSSKVNNSVPAMPESYDSVPVTSAPKSSESFIKVNTTVEKIQVALKNAHFYTGKVDGKAGPATKAAIVEFQRSKGLTADGVIGRKTWDLLKAYLR